MKTRVRRHAPLDATASINHSQHALRHRSRQTLRLFFAPNKLCRKPSDAARVIATKSATDRSCGQLMACGVYDQIDIGYLKTKSAFCSQSPAVERRPQTRGPAKKSRRLFVNSSACPTVRGGSPPGVRNLPWRIASQSRAPHLPFPKRREGPADRHKFCEWRGRIHCHPC